jgi:hypothetical protein
MRTTALQEEQQTLLDTPEDGQLGRNMWCEEQEKRTKSFQIKGILKTNKIVASYRYKTQLWQTVMNNKRQSSR